MSSSTGKSRRRAFIKKTSRICGTFTPKSLSLPAPRNIPKPSLDELSEDDNDPDKDYDVRRARDVAMAIEA